MDKHMENESKLNALREGCEAKSIRSRKNVRTWMFTAIAVMLVMSAVMGSAWAYFTTNASAKGGITLNLGHQEEINETFDDWEKVIDLTSTSDSNLVYLRAKAYCAEYDVTYSHSKNWTDGGDGWMYYTKTLAPGASLSDTGDELKAKINDVPKSGSDGLEGGKTFNVIIVYESLEVQFDADGKELPAQEADWSRDLQTTRTITSDGGEE